MSNIRVVIDERLADIGNFSVRRLLPFRNKRMVGPFIFIDHMGPANLSVQQNIDIAPHPHIGLSTLTYLFEGCLMHRDSLGNALEIKPGEVNWMTAGKGIVHSERTPEYLRKSSKTMHGLQIWVALPKNKEQMKPEFFHIEKNDLPVWNENDLSYKLIAGEAAGRKSPVPVCSKLFFIEIKSKVKKRISIGKDLFGEAGVFILEGSIECEGNVYLPKQLLVVKESKLLDFVMEAGSSVYVLGGDAFPEEPFIYWNFVASERDLIEMAKEKWSAQRYPKISGETDFVPLPEIKK